MLFTAGCTRPDERAAVPNKDRNVLHLFNWNNYISTETVRRFEKSCDCRLSQDYYSDNEEMLAKLAAGATRLRSHRPHEQRDGCSDPAGRPQATG